MLSGRRLDLLDPSPFDVEIEDIAHGLARVARWNGQTHGAHPFSVAQHSLLVEEIFGTLSNAITPADRLAALLHDAPEYVVGDLISPFKAVVGAPYKGVEERLQRAIRLRFGLPPRPSDRCARFIKIADQIAAFREAVDLAGFSEAEADRFFRRPSGWAGRTDATLAPWPTQTAQSAFLDRYHSLSSAIE